MIDHLNGRFMRNILRWIRVELEITKYPLKVILLKYEILSTFMLRIWMGQRKSRTHHMALFGCTVLHHVTSMREYIYAW